MSAVLQGTSLSPKELRALHASLPSLAPAEQSNLLEILEELERRQHVDLCRRSLIEFCRHVEPSYIVAPHHARLARLLEDMALGRKDRLAISIPPRHGKLCADNTPVITPQGWTTHGALKPGGQVFGPDGQPTTVVAVSEPGMASVAMTFSTGDTILVHENHEWLLFHTSSKTWRVRESGSLLDRQLWYGKRGERGSKTAYRLPKISPLQFPAKQLPLHPYLLGIWLGDGSTGKPCITMDVADTAVVAPLFEAEGFGITVTHMHPDTGVPTTSFAFADSPVSGFTTSRLTLALRAAGVFDDKHIPQVYLQASVEQRLQLLAGLIDSDGYVDQESQRVIFSSTNPGLVTGFLDLATGLGLSPYVTETAPQLSSSGIQGQLIIYQVGFNSTTPVPTRLSRKRITGYMRRPSRAALTDIRRIPTPEIGRCIQVDRADGLYLVGRNLTPTHNSLLVSILFPAWFLGRYPEKSVLMVSHTADLATDFGRKVRNLVASSAFKEIFPTVSLAQDSKSAGRWNTNHNGTYYAAGVGGAIAGRGGDIIVVDDPHNEQDLLNGQGKADFERSYQWFMSGLRTRLMSQGRIAVVHTRWDEEDLIGHLVADGEKNPGADQYEVFEFPAILELPNPNRNSDPNAEPAFIRKALWPEKFDLQALDRTRASMPASQWAAQYLQSPSAEEGALLKRDWWRPWPDLDPPQCSYIIIGLDAAAETKTTNDFTAILTFGIFNATKHSRITGIPGPEPDDSPNATQHIILLNAINVRVEFPELKRLALEQYKSWEPDAFIVEKKSAGSQLYQELRRVGVLVQEFTPSRATGDKVARVNAVSPILESGVVWYPEGRRWAEEVIEQCAAFPRGKHDDLVDVFSMCMARFRAGGFIRLESDKDDWADSSDLARGPRRAPYY